MSGETPTTGKYRQVTGKYKQVTSKCGQVAGKHKQAIVFKEAPKIGE